MKKKATTEKIAKKSKKGEIKKKPTTTLKPAKKTSTKKKEVKKSKTKEKKITAKKIKITAKEKPKKVAPKRKEKPKRVEKKVIAKIEKKPKKIKAKIEEKPKKVIAKVKVKERPKKIAKKVVAKKEKKIPPKAIKKVEIKKVFKKPEKKIKAKVEKKVSIRKVKKIEIKKTVVEPKVKVEEKYPPAPLEALPTEYGENGITLMTVDPYKLFAFWEVREDTLAMYTGNLTIRIYDVTGVDFDGMNANSYFDIAISERIGSLYIDVSPEKEFVADIGIVSPYDTFITIARSNKVSTPRAMISEEGLLPKKLYETGLRVGY